MSNGIRAPYQPPQTVCAVRIHPHGTITDRGNHKLASTGRPPTNAKRAAIHTLSRASAARLRRLLAQVQGPSGWRCFGATLTVPGPPITVEEWHRLWNAFRHRLLRNGNITLLWRIELQERGQPHVHCVCWGHKAISKFRMDWLENLGLLGPYEGPQKNLEPVAHAQNKEEVVAAGETWIKISHRGIWPGADRHAVRIDSLDGGDNMGWWRYLAAHASKSKQAQLGWRGRQWGTLNKRLLDLSEPTVLHLHHTALNKVIRCMRRLTKCRYASGHGSQTWFASPRTVKRLCAWAEGGV